MKLHLPCNPGQGRALGLAAGGLALLLAIACHAPAAMAQDPRATKLYQEAQKRYEQRELGAAAVNLYKARGLDPRSAPVHLLLGRVLLEEGDLAGAERVLLEAERLGAPRAELALPLAEALLAQGKHEALLQDARFLPEGLPPALSAQLLPVLAAAQAEAGQLPQALRSLEQARALGPQQLQPWLAEVPLRLRAGQHEQAGAAAQRALELAREPRQRAEALYLLGTVAHAQSSLPQALKAYEQALALQPQHLEALLARAGLALDQGNAAQARTDLQAVSRQHPREPRAQYLLALLAEREGDTAAARKALQAVAEQLAPVSPAFLRQRPQLLLLGGLAHHGLGEFAKARPYLEALQRLQPAGPGARLLGQVLLADKAPARAAEVLQTYLNTHPGDLGAIELLVAALLAQGQASQAAELLQQALQRQDAPQLQALLGMSLAREGRAEEAMAALQAALQRAPQNLAAGTALLQLQLQAGHTGPALALAQRLAGRAQQDAGLQELLGRARLQAGDSDGARRAFEQALRLQPQRLSAELQLARIDFAAGKAPAALQRLQAALRKAGAEQRQAKVELMNGIAGVEASSGREAEALRWLERAADLAAPQDAQALLNLFEHQMRQQRHEAALQAARRLEQWAPEDPRTHFAVARAALALQNPETARAALARASRLAEPGAAAQTRVALLQLAAGDARGARDSLAKALRAEPAHLQAQALMVDAKIALGELPAAEQRAREIARRHPQQALGHALLGDVARARGQGPAAVAAYRQALKLQPDSAAMLRLFSVQAAQDPRAAVQEATRWLAARPNDDAVRQALGDLHASRGEMAAARQAYAPLLQRPAPPPELLNNAAHVLLALGDTAGAARAAEAALAARPGVAHLLGTAGWVAFHEGRRELALQRLSQARQRDPGNADTRYFLAHVLASSGRSAEAREELQAALGSPRPLAHAQQARTLLASLQ